MNSFANLLLAVALTWASADWSFAEAQRPTASDLMRVTTVVPFPRGLAVVDGDLYVLCRGRVRGAGGVSAKIDDQAGTLYVVDPTVFEPVTHPEIGEAVRTNGKLFAPPTDPPFHLWDRASDPPESDRRTDRPYCTLRYHEPTKSFYLCAFSGIDQPKKPGEVSFSKNLNDALLRFDLRTQQWHEVERHKMSAGGNYPHHDPRYNAPPHGWLNGPDNCLAVGNWLYAVAKDNSRLVRYDLSALVNDPNAGAPPATLVLGENVPIKGQGEQVFYGHSTLARHGDWLYVGCRTSSVIFRIKLDLSGAPIEPIVGELVARFEPFDPQTMTSANITDMDFDEKGRLYVISAKPARVFRFKPDPRNIYDARKSEPWADLAAMTDNSKMKSENVLVYDNRLYVTSGDGYAYQQGADGTVYAIAIAD